ncbi:MAG: D-Ala-D-Ala carboxypeptidase family metallohydrolase [Rhizobiaceae bacterium]
MRRSTSLAGLSAVAALCIGLGACSSTGDPGLALDTISPAGGIAPLGVAEADSARPAPAQIALSGEAAMTAPSKKPDEPDAGSETGASARKPAPAAEAGTQDDARQAAERAPAAQQAVEPAPQSRQAAEKAATGEEERPKQVLENGGPILTAGQMPASPLPARKKGFLSSFFGAREASAAPVPLVDTQAEPRTSAPETTKTEEKAAEKSKPLVVLTSTPGQQKPLSMASLGRTTGGDALPGVRSYENLFEIKRKSGTDDTSDIDIHEDEGGGSVRLASAAGLARLAPNGLLRQREDVDVSCLKPALVSMLRQVESRFGKKVVVTSGYRSPTHNRRVNGAQKSQHMYCAAADVQVPGVSKWELARFARSLQGRGGVGTYCHTESVHIDVGPERDWNWRCRRRG